MARILVRAFRKNFPGSLQVVARNICWAVSLWWEAPPWESQVVPRSILHKRDEREIKDEGGVVHALVLACRSFKLKIRNGGQMSRLSVAKGLGLQRV